jgi:excisionase family DNA binding protein
MRGSRSNQHRKVEQARAVARLALGDTPRPEALPVAAKYVPTTRPAEPLQVRSESIGVLLLGEVAARLGISRAEVERMIAAGKMRALPTGYTKMIPTREVERLLKTGRT